ncbi:hypothetical protein SO694_00031273 [Aureococcus anophagefferens]|uniref:Uncharacterized protein n=1 Tax=Aureococcus anophagefferens TaxID=44056 RepID=A0ABR1FJL9_AURAN
MFRRLVLAAATTIAAGQTFDFEDCQPEGCIFPFIYYGVTYDGCTDVWESSASGSYRYPCAAAAPSSEAPVVGSAVARAVAGHARDRRRGGAAADDDDELALFDAGGIAWSRSEKRTVWYRWILRSLGVLALGLLAVLEPILVVAESRVSDAQKRTLLLLSVCDAGFVACFLIELWYTRRVLLRAGAPDQGRAARASSPVSFTANPLQKTFDGAAVELPEAPSSTRSARLGSGPRRSTAWRLGERAPAPARRSTAGRPGER